MTDEAALLRAVLDRPDDATAQLVYADWLDERGDPRGAWVRAAAGLAGLKPKSREAAVARANMDLLRPDLSADWLALFDLTDKYTVLVPADIRKTRQRNEWVVGQPLLRLDGWGNANCDFARMGVTHGDYVYPLAVEKGRVFVLTRMRVDRLEGLAGHVVAASAAPLRFDRQVPPEVLLRMKFRPRRGDERQLGYLADDGTLKNAIGLQGVYRLTHASGRDLDWLFFRDTAPEHA